MKAQTFSKLFKGVAVAATLATLAAPAALARPGSAGPHDPWYSYALSLGGKGTTFITDTLAPGGDSARIQSYRSSRSLRPVGCGRALPVSLAQAKACATQHVVTRRVENGRPPVIGETITAGRFLGV